MKIAAALLIAAMSVGAQPADTLLKAMTDEMARSTKLKLSDLETPYFIEYTLEDASFFTASGLT